MRIAMSTAKASLKPVAELQVSRHMIPRYKLIPNSSIQNRPLLIYHSAFVPPASATTIESLLTWTGVVDPRWRYTMYSTTHEVLCIARGKARLCFGSEDNPQRVESVVQKGDVLIVPAGVGHRLLEVVEGGFEMVGSYPVGPSWDMCYGKEGEESKVQDISRLAWFEKDPIYGDEGPALEG